MPVQVAVALPLPASALAIPSYPRKTAAASGAGSSVSGGGVPRPSSGVGLQVDTGGNVRLELRVGVQRGGVERGIQPRRSRIIEDGLALILATGGGIRWASYPCVAEKMHETRSRHLKSTRSPTLTEGSAVCTRSRLPSRSTRSSIYRLAPYPVTACVERVNVRLL